MLWLVVTPVSSWSGVDLLCAWCWLVVSPVSRCESQAPCKEEKCQNRFLSWFTIFMHDYNFSLRLSICHPLFVYIHKVLNTKAARSPKNAGCNCDVLCEALSHITLISRQGLAFSKRYTRALRLQWFIIPYYHHSLLSATHCSSPSRLLIRC